MQKAIDRETALDDELGGRLYGLAAELFPICRSITGDGVRETLQILGRHIDVEVHEVASGTNVLDWVVPREWQVRDAYIADADGRRIVDYRASNLHVLNYSAPVRAKLSLEELKSHIFTLPEQPGLIPYRTSYYEERWGFCMSHEAFCELEPGIYEAVIDTSFTEGALTYGEYLKAGDSAEEILLSAHVCHPSLANDNCSGLALLTLLAAELSGRRTRYSYRFVFAPGTIGAITWLSRNRDCASRIKHGLVVSCVGDGGGPTYKRSRRGDAPIDRAMAHVLKHEAPSAVLQDFVPYGYDERQFCSPGFNLPVGLFQRSQYGTFPEYHTSADNLDFISPEHLAKSYRLIKAALDILEQDRVMVNTKPFGEPALGRRGLYATIGGQKSSPEESMALLWTLNFADGDHTLLDIAERAGLPFHTVHRAACRLEACDLLAPPVAH